MKEFPPFWLDTANQCLWRVGGSGDEERILLPPKALAVLQYLVEHAGRLVTHNELLEAVWRGSVVEPQAVKKNILDVRNALGDRPKNSLFIETVPKRGYRFIAPVADRIAAGPSVSEKAATRSHLVGRHWALRELHDGLQCATRSERQILFVTGEPGIGKTALVDEFQRQVASTALSVRIARGQCVEGYGGKEAYFPMLDALGRLCRGPQGDSVVQILAAQAPTWLVQFPGLLKPEHRETLQRELLGATRDRMLREIGEALETMSAERPLLLVFEDLQWVDDSTVDLISALARRNAPAKLLLVATCRPLDLQPGDYPLRQLTQDLLVHRLCRQVALPPLSAAEVEEYLTTQSNAASPPEGLSLLLHRHTEGNPLFMIAALDDMTKRSLISRENGGWQLLVPLAQIELAVPEDLRRMIEAQLEQLSTQERSALELASVAGMTFAASVIGPAAEIDPQTFEDVCEELSRRHRVVRWFGTQRFPDGTVSERYEFMHALYRRVLYDRQAPGRRARLHGSIAERLEVMYAQQLDEVVPELAHHFEEAANLPCAVDYLRRAAEIAARRYAPAQADSLLVRALELVRQLPEPQRAHRQTDLLSRLASNRAAALDMRAIETYETLAARAQHYRLIDVQVRALIDASNLLALVSAENCLEALQQAQHLSAVQDPLSCMRTRASCAFRRLLVAGWSAKDARECSDALAHLHETGDASILTPHLIEEGFLRWFCGDYREAHRLALETRAELLQRSGESPYLQSLVPCSLQLMGEWGEALRELFAGIAQAEENGDFHITRLLRLYVASMHLDACDFEGALALCEQALPLVRDPSPHLAPGTRDAYPHELRMALICSGSAAAACGDFERALEDLSSVSRDMDRQTVLFDWYQRMPLAAGLAELWHAKGDRARAQLAAEQFLDCSLATEEHTWQARAWEANARLALANLDRERARICIAEALSIVGSHEVPVAAWQVYATAARTAEESGNLRAAHSHRDRCRATILGLANSLPEQEPLRRVFLAAPIVAAILSRDS